MAVRKRASAMTVGEQERLIRVISRLIQNGTYGTLASHHANMMHNMHGMNPVGTQRFLPWHRVYLLKLEQAMQAIDPLAFIPYWRWTRNRAVPSWLVNFRPTVNVPGQGNLTVTRNPPAPGVTLPTQTQVTAVLALPNHTQLTTQLEVGPHNRVHIWCRGTMSFIPTAPADPLFWLHHAQVDRLWSLWQATHPSMHPALSGNNRILDPWPETEQQVRSIAALGYSYQGPALP